MSEETQVAETEVVADKLVKTRKNKIIEAGDGYKVYVTTEKHTVSFDIMIKGELLTGQWSSKNGIVEFAVPNHLVEGFEKHYHFVSGNVVSAD